MSQEEHQHQAEQANVMNEVKEKAEQVREKVEPTVRVIRDQAAQSFEVRATVNPVQVVTMLATVGILWTQRRHLRFVKQTIKNMDKNMEGAQQAIAALREAGQSFTFYPGVGVYVD